MNRLFWVAVLLWSVSLPVRDYCSADEVRGNPAAHRLPGEFASEHWELTAQFDSGHLLFAEVILTNIGLGDRNAVVLGHVIGPDGKAYRFSNGRREGNWTLSSDRLRIEVGANLLDLHSPLYLLQVSKRSIKLDLQLRPEAQPLWAQALAPPGYTLEVLALATSIKGMLWLNDMSEPLPVSGVVTMTHSWTNASGASLVLRRVEFFSLQKELPVYLLDLTAPTGTRRRWLVMKDTNGQSYSSEQFDLSLLGELTGDHDHGYTIPRALQVKNEDLEGQVQLESPILQADPLADLSRPLRYVVSLALNLHPRRVWAKSPIDWVWHTSPGAGPIRAHGTGITAITFVNPLSSTVAKALDGGQNGRRSLAGDIAENPVPR